MNQGKYVFSQLVELISYKQFQTLVNRHGGGYKVKDFSCWKQFLCMAFGQLTHRESLSDTILCLKTNATKSYHLGIGQVVSKSTLSKANENRSYLIYQDLAMTLIKEAQLLYKDDNNLTITLANNIYAIDATTIDLCLSTFYWAVFRSSKAGIKLHTQLDIKTSIPKFIHITNANIHDVNMLDEFKYETDSFYVMDKGYTDYKRLSIINQTGAYFITRAKINMSFTRMYSNKKLENTGVIFDQIVTLNQFQARKDYNGKLRIVKYKDDKGKVYLFLTNNFEIKALEVCTLYKNRWQIELFFKWIKQHLKIKKFWGQSENAVKTQVWIAVSIYILVAISKKKFKLEQSLYEILQILSINIFEKTPINQLFQSNQLQYSKEQIPNQLVMWE